MERIASADARIVGIAEHLLRPQPASLSGLDPMPDPAALLHAERERVLDEARAQGFADGLRSAETEIQARVRAAEAKIEQSHEAQTERLRAANERLAGLLRDLPDAVVRWETQTANMASEIAYAALVRLLGERNADDASWRVELCRQALAECRLRPGVVRIAKSQSAGLAALAESDSIRIVGDAELAPGDCRLETHRGLYDSGLEIRLEALKQALLRGLRSGPSQ